jgi:hypothetical protein
MKKIVGTLFIAFSVLTFIVASASAYESQSDDECRDGCNTYNCHAVLCTLEYSAVGALLLKERVWTELLHRL